MSKYNWFDENAESEMELSRRKKHHHHKDKMKDAEGAVIIFAEKVNIFINQEEEKHKKKY